MRYVGDLYRPPSEAYSYILQVTIGCSHNRCSFCNMYAGKKFRLRPVEELLEDLAMARRAYRHVRRIFLADGDALVAPMETLRAVLGTILNLFPECERVTSYSTAGDILRRTPQELSELRSLGLEMLYLGLESGSEEVLKQINKGISVAETVEACIKAQEAGFKMSVTQITGLAGKDGSEAHALASAEALSKMKPAYIGLMTLTLRRGTALSAAAARGEFVRLTPRELTREMRVLVGALDSEGSVLRSNHISNYVELRGTMNKDKDHLLSQLDKALASDIWDDSGVQYLERL